MIKVAVVYMPQQLPGLPHELGVPQQPAGTLDPTLRAEPVVLCAESNFSSF
jgi:hypothetical protein